jgi:hypothetical protein
LNIAAVSLDTLEGAVSARIKFPLQALAKFGVNVQWGAGQISIPNQADDGLLILHRAFFNDASFVSTLDTLIENGWIVINDIDDDLTHREEFVADNYYCLRYCHAVTVSTGKLAESYCRFNPDTYVLSNAVPYLLDPKQSPTGPCRVFFGALNRYQDWLAIKDGVVSALDRFKDRFELVIVHDEQVFASLPAGIKKRVVPTLGYDQYLSLLSESDIALLPLNDNVFNRGKSDLKLIESAGVGCVPIFSPTVYGEVPIHAEIGLMANSPKEWEDALSQLILDPADREARKIKGQHYVKNYRMHSHQALNRYTLYQQLLAKRDQLEQRRRQRLASGGVKGI